MPYDIDNLKANLPEYLERIGAQVTYLGENRLKCHCPLHDDARPSFTADFKGGAWVWHCFPCGRGGSVIDLEGYRAGTSPGSYESFKGVAEVLGITEDRHEGKPFVSDQERLQRLQRANAEEAKRKSQELITQRLDDKLDSFLKPYRRRAWRADLGSGSLFDPRPIARDPHFFIKSMFHSDQIIWMGETYDSGNDWNKDNFRPCGEWLNQLSLPPRVAAGTFNAGTISRARDSVLDAPFIVIESDNLIGHKPRNEQEREQNKAESFALFWHCQEVLKLYPRAVIDTGNKSLHLWFDRPEPDELSALIKISQGLRIDTDLLKNCASSPMRLPGTIHEKTDRPAELLFTNYKH